jgi:small subunit ribosomal protein S6e
MVFKLNISQKGKAWKLELEQEILVGKKIGDKIEGKEISSDLNGYELQITGASDSSGFPHKPDVEGPDRKSVLLTKGWGMHKRPRKEGKKKVSTPKGLRLRKSVRGSQISDKTVQINLNVLKEGSKKFPEIFPDQNKSKETEKEKPTETPTPKAEDKPDTTTNQIQDNNKVQDNKEKVEEEVKEEIKEEIKEDIPEAPETKTEEKKEEAAEKVAEEVIEDLDVPEVRGDKADEEKSKQ